MTPHLLLILYLRSHFLPSENRPRVELFAMRLINTATLQLREFISDFPSYAILSHTWGAEEVTFQDLTETHRLPSSAESDLVRHRKGYQKIVEFCSKARANDFEWAWADTCCIDKTSSSELSEAINSMYKWYAGSSVCYVYLEDVEPLPLGWHLTTESEQKIKASRWFSRGWTLQELIAPDFITFFSRDWSDLGSKFSLELLLVERTGIPKEVLRGESPSFWSAAARMSWAAERETSREEDMAYSLMGIFDIHMPLLYGEGGPKAFLRLQEEIWKQSEAYSLLVWPFQDLDEPSNSPMCVLAPHPRYFKVPFEIPILPDAQPTGRSVDFPGPIKQTKTIFSWDDILQDRTVITTETYRSLSQRMSKKSANAPYRAQLVKLFESIPSITPRGLSTFLPMTKFGSENNQFLAWPFCMLHGFSLCVRLWNDTFYINNVLENFELPFSLSRRTGYPTLWAVPSIALEKSIADGLVGKSGYFGKWVLRNVSLQARPTPRILFRRPIMKQFQFVVDITSGSGSSVASPHPIPFMRVETLDWFPKNATVVNHCGDCNPQEGNNWLGRRSGMEAGVLLCVSNSEMMSAIAGALANKIWVLVLAESHPTITGAFCCSIQAFPEPSLSLPLTTGNGLRDATMNDGRNDSDRCVLDVKYETLELKISSAVQYTRRQPMDRLSLSVIIKRQPNSKTARGDE